MKFRFWPYEIGKRPLWRQKFKACFRYSICHNVQFIWINFFDFRIFFQLESNFELLLPSWLMNRAGHELFRIEFELENFDIVPSKQVYTCWLFSSRLYHRMLNFQCCLSKYQHEGELPNLALISNWPWYDSNLPQSPRKDHLYVLSQNFKYQVSKTGQCAALIHGTCIIINEIPYVFPRWLFHYSISVAYHLFLQRRHHHRSIEPFWYRQRYVS